MSYRRIFSLLLSLVILFTLIPPAETSAIQTDTYATIITASDFQGGETAFPHFGRILSTIAAEGYSAPDAFFFGGDYGDSSGVDPAKSTERVMEQIDDVYPGYSRNQTVFVQGNHDAADDSGAYLTPTGFYAFDDFVVYSINEDSFKTKQSTREEYDQDVQELAEDVRKKLSELVTLNDRRPVFILTHVPLHHSSRRSYGDTLYSRYLFDVLNKMGTKLDIFFLFGHNHSSSYDDYIGGSVNYLAKGQLIRIPIPDTAFQGIDGYTEEELRFTYLNYGYVGYSNNTPTSTSANRLTCGVFEIAPTHIAFSRYSEDGLHCREIIPRICPETKDPHITIAGKTNGSVGESAYFSAYVGNITDPVYSWRSTNTDIADLYPAGSETMVLYKKAGSVSIEITVKGNDGNTYTKSVDVHISSATISNQAIEISAPGTNVPANELSFPSVTFGEQVLLKGHISGFSEKADYLYAAWSSSNPAVATVKNGLLTFHSTGSTIIGFTVGNGISRISKSVNIEVSQYPNTTGVYRLTDHIEAGKTYMIASSSSPGETVLMSSHSFQAADGKQRLSAELGNLTPMADSVSLYTESTNLEWTAVESISPSGEAAISLQNAQGKYLCANFSGIFCTDSILVASGTRWTVNSDGHLISDSNYGPSFSTGSGYASKDSPKKCYVYEKVAMMSWAVASVEELHVDATKTSNLIQPFDFSPPQEFFLRKLSLKTIYVPEVRASVKLSMITLLIPLLFS